MIYIGIFLLTVGMIGLIALMLHEKEVDKVHAIRLENFRRERGKLEGQLRLIKTNGEDRGG